MAAGYFTLTENWKGLKNAVTVRYANCGRMSSEKYLEKQHIELDENNLEPTVECLKDIYRDIQNNIEEERRKKVRREKVYTDRKGTQKRACGRTAECPEKSRI